LAQASKEATTTKVTLALTGTAVLLGGFLLLKSDAAALPGLVDPPAVTKNYFSIQKAGCFLDERYCRAGFHACHPIPSGAHATACRVKVSRTHSTGMRERKAEPRGAMPT
jgi:hypothetical protein